MAKVTVCFTLDNEQDRDLVRWLDGLHKRKKSEAIREALRSHLGRGSVTIGDVYQAVRELERKLQTGAAVSAASHPSEEWDEPADIAAALDGLGL